MKTAFYGLVFCVVIAGCEGDDAKTTDCPIRFSSPVSNSSASVIANPTPPTHPCDYITARKNDVEWTVHAKTSFGFENDTLYVHGSGNEETLGFRFLFTGPGTYEITAKADNRYFDSHAYYCTTVGLDVITSFYQLAQKATVEIVEYNETERVIKGHFEFSLSEYAGSSALRFEQGTFRVHLPD
jgi:hypothetical protein